MANRNTADAASKANEQTISTTENKKRMPTRKDGRCFRNTSDGYKMAIAPRRGMKPMKNQTSEGNCNHRDNHSAETMCHTKHDKNARKILGLCAGYVWLESITTQCRPTISSGTPDHWRWNPNRAQSRRSLERRVGPRGWNGDSDHVVSILSSWNAVFENVPNDETRQQAHKDQQDAMQSRAMNACPD